MTAEAEPVVARFRDAIARRLGLAFADIERLEELRRILNARLAARGGTELDYLRELEEAPSAAELLELAALVTVTETHFFRYPHQFLAYREQGLRPLVERNTPIRVLSAGCASGEEAYSLAIIAHDYFGGADIQVTALDINPKALERAAQGEYSLWSLRGTSSQIRQAHFETHGKLYRLNKAIRQRVRFESRNLADPDVLLGQLPFDIIFCRNVLMYFTREQFERAVRRLERSLVVGGYLFLGHAETLRGVDAGFELCHTHGTFYYRRVEGTGKRQPGGIAAPESATLTPSWIPEPALAANWWSTIEESSEKVRSLAEARSPTATSASQRSSVGDLPSSAAERLGVPLSLHREERFAEALSFLQALPADVRDLPDAVLLEAVLLFQHGRLEEAQRACRQLIEQSLAGANAHYLLAQCADAQGQLDYAIEHDELALQKDPSFAMPRLHLARLYRRLGQQDRARLELSRARAGLEFEDSARIALFGAGFGRASLVEMCDAEERALGERWR